ncbi:hypothetical protein RBB77_17875 [Tunturibacter psychrotolerans]|uniref:Uncharacterized protein n=1 Tax=Tunturiibacter psychrotolerans TaxID=3069686 RepID=A0AAU7ZM46_9BACT
MKSDPVSDMAMLATDTGESFAALDLSPAKPDLGDAVVALLYDLDGNFRLQLGTFVGVMEQRGPQGESLSRIAVSMPGIELGSSGTSLSIVKEDS